jgi:hypothetical protein
MPEQALGFGEDSLAWIGLGEGLGHIWRLSDYDPDE